MKWWTRHPSAVFCGYCTTRIAPGDPVLEIGLQRLKRCVDCAGEPVPKDLPELLPRSFVTVQPMPKPKKAAPLRDLAADWKARQSGADR